MSPYTNPIVTRWLLGLAVAVMVGTSLIICPLFFIWSTPQPDLAPTVVATVAPTPSVMATSGSTPTATLVPSTGYNGERAAIEALKRAANQDSPAWFVSQVLWAGGMTKEENVWTEGTYTANNPQDLADYLFHRYLEPRDTGVVNIPRPGDTVLSRAQPGDLLVYDWAYYERNPNDRAVGDLSHGFQVQHIAVVVAVDGNSVTVAEGGRQALWPGAVYQTRGWMQSPSGESLQKMHPGIAGKLMYFSPGLK